MKFKEGQKVYVDCGHIKGLTEVVGIAQIALTYLGQNIIVKTEGLSGIDSDSYPFSTCAIFEKYVTPIEDN